MRACCRQLAERPRRAAAPRCIELGTLGRDARRSPTPSSAAGRRRTSSNGTDHGTANVHFALGGRVKGGLYGAAPRLDQLAPTAIRRYALDFRSVYATVLERWWGVPSGGPLGGRFAPLDLLRA